ncbi:MAG TPA: hypothetical protein VGB30_13400 [bacterium]
MSNLREIVKYGVRYNLDKRRAVIRLVDNKDNCYEFKVKKARDLHMLLHLLQNEKPIFLNVEDHYLSSTIESVGEKARNVETLNLKESKSDDDDDDDDDAEAEPI